MAGDFGGRTRAVGEVARRDLFGHQRFRQKRMQQTQTERDQVVGARQRRRRYDHCCCADQYGSIKPPQVIAADLGRRVTLAEIAAQVGVSPVYLTQIF